MRCAYCGVETKPTREHVWPDCFLNRVGREFAHYSPLSGEVHGGDYIVRDVCATCNNTKLSTLDSYFCSLWDQYFQKPQGANATVHFVYSFDLLLRSLLKIAYNTARSCNSETPPLERCAKYILDGGQGPTGVALIAELVSPSYFANITDPLAGPREIRPTMYRSARGVLNTANGKAVLVRIVAVGSFFFHILLSRDPNDPKTFDLAVAEFLAGIKGTVPVLPFEKSVVLYSSPQDSLRSMLPLLEGKREGYIKFFANRKKKPKNK